MLEITFAKKEKEKIRYWSSFFIQKSEKLFSCTHCTLECFRHRLFEFWDFFAFYSPPSQLFLSLFSFLICFVCISWLEFSALVKVFFFFTYFHGYITALDSFLYMFEFIISMRSVFFLWKKEKWKKKNQTYFKHKLCHTKQKGEQRVRKTHYWMCVCVCVCAHTMSRRKEQNQFLKSCLKLYVVYNGKNQDPMTPIRSLTQRWFHCIFFSSLFLPPFPSFILFFTF